MNDRPDDSRTTETWTTSFMRQHKRSPSVRLDGIEAWLSDQIEYLESIKRTPFGDGALSAFRNTQREIEYAKAAT